MQFIELTGLDDAKIFVNRDLIFSYHQPSGKNPENLTKIVYNAGNLLVKESVETIHKLLSGDTTTEA
ncbi:MAG: hypothetical protein JWM28_2048 [Chitinophagaceae bacterium]|nr:hypothetical protein [Chitinophagaceae bacterium]